MPVSRKRKTAKIKPSVKPHEIRCNFRQTDRLLATLSKGQIEDLSSAFKDLIHGVPMYEGHAYAATIHDNEDRTHEPVTVYVDLAKQELVMGFVSEIRDLVTPEKWEQMYTVSPEQLEAMKDGGEHTHH
jgi:hypothetical protein